MSEVSRLLSIQQSTTSPYHAMGNGVVENFNIATELVFVN